MAEDIKFTDLNSIRIAKPCRVAWNDMQKIEHDRIRHCAKCNLNVYNLSEMSRREAIKLIEEHEGELCVRFFSRKDGTILTQDCPVGIKAAEHTPLKIVGRILLWPLEMFISIPVIHNRLRYFTSHMGGIDEDSLCPPDLVDIWREKYPTIEAELEAIRERVDEANRKRNNGGETN